MNELALSVFAGETGSHLLSPPRSERWAAFLAGFDTAAYVSSLTERGYRWLARSAPAFPSGLASIFDAPVGVYLRGAAPPALLERPSVAIVGARACSPYGAQVARMLGRELTAAGLVVVSGLARGIDAEAHRGALDAGGATVGVLGCGIDRDYPASHRALAGDVARTGLIVSEYPPGVEPAPWRFPARNRIVAGLAQVTVVVEARERSGALITADLALEEGREVFAVPGEITSTLSAGTNALLRLGATALTSAADVLESFGLAGAPAHGVGEAASDAARTVLESVRAHPSGADELARRLELSPGAVAAALAELELAGLVGEGEGVYRAV